MSGILPFRIPERDLMRHDIVLIAEKLNEVVEAVNELAAVPTDTPVPGGEEDPRDVWESQRKQAFEAWCERANFAPDDPESPHTEAFYAGYDAAHVEVLYWTSQAASYAQRRDEHRVALERAGQALRDVLEILPLEAPPQWGRPDFEYAIKNARERIDAVGAPQRILTSLEAALLRSPDEVLFDVLADVLAEAERQDERHGRYEGLDQGRERLALANLEDEVIEALDSWRDERGVTGWPRTREEVLQVAAVAVRALRDAL